MDCYPPCKVCTGLCKQPAPARRVVPSPDGTTQKKAVAPRKMPGYIVLICGTATTPEEQRTVMTAAGKRFPRSLTQRTKFWCDKHSHWVRPYTFAERLEALKTEELPF